MNQVFVPALISGTPPVRSECRYATKSLHYTIYGDALLSALKAEDESVTVLDHTIMESLHINYYAKTLTSFLLITVLILTFCTLLSTRFLPT